ncbi:hypothetical protein H0H92_015471, partial [Tricholoma furcatifolium]
TSMEFSEQEEQLHTTISRILWGLKGMAKAVEMDSTNYMGGTALQVYNRMLVSFYGFFGSGDTMVNITIDEGEQFAATIEQAPIIACFYTTPTLLDGPHIINMTSSPSSFLLLDYMVVMVGNNTSLQSQTLILDDTDSMFMYEGS